MGSGIRGTPSQEASQLSGSTVWARKRPQRKILAPVCDGEATHHQRPGYITYFQSLNGCALTSLIGYALTSSLVLLLRRTSCQLGWRIPRSLICLLKLASMPACSPGLYSGCFAAHGTQLSRSLRRSQFLWEHRSAISLAATLHDSGLWRRAQR